MLDFWVEFSPVGKLKLYYEKCILKPPKMQLHGENFSKSSLEEQLHF